MTSRIRDDLEEEWKERRRLLGSEIENFSIEKRYCRKDGSTVWVNLTLSLVRKADGSADYYISVYEDISARKQAEEKLRDSEERLRLALRAAGLGVFEWNVQADRAVWENERMYQMFGHTSADGTLSKERVNRGLYVSGRCRHVGAGSRGRNEVRTSRSHRLPHPPQGRRDAMVGFILEF